MKRFQLTCCLAIVMLFMVAAGPPPPAKQKRGLPARALAPSAAASLGLSPFTVIHSANVNDYQDYQFKITYLGSQLKTTPSLFGVGTGRSFSLPAFTPYERAFSYANDRQGGTTLTLSSAEFKAFVDALSLQPALLDTTLRADPNLSLMILRGAGPATRCWEHLCPTDAQSDTLFQTLHDALPDTTRRTIVDSFRHQMAGVRR